MSSSAPAAVKRWPSWVVLALVVVGLLAFGASRDSGPRTESERVDAIAKRLACPECNGESVFESRSGTSQSLRNQITVRVREGVLTDDEIIADIERSYNARVLLVPKATGIDALVWALPAAAFVCAAAGLAIAFLRWRSRGQAAPTDADRELVAAALEASEP